MRLAVVSLVPDVSWAGSDHLWAAMVEKALARGHDVALELPLWPEAPAPVRQLVEAGAKYPVGPSDPTGPTQPATLAARARARAVRRPASGRPQDPETIVDRLERFGPDVVCVNQGVTYAVGRPDVHEWLASLPFPYVLLTNGSDDRHDVGPDERRRLQAAYGRAEALGFPALATQACAERQMCMALPDAFLFDYPNVMAEIGPLPWPEPSASGTAELAYVGRVSVAKGIDGLFQTLGAAKWRERDYRLRLFGDVFGGDYFPDLARANGIAEQVELCGHTADVAAVWATSQLLVFPSRMEGAPIALAEAMYCGRPAVATAVGSIPEWITDGRSGFLAGGPDPRQLDDALERAWQSRDRWAEVGRSASEAIRAAVDPAIGAMDLLDRLVAVAARESAATEPRRSRPSA